MSEILKSKIKERLDYYTSKWVIQIESAKHDYQDKAIYDARIALLDDFIYDLQWFIGHMNHEEGEQKKTEKPTPITYGWENIIAGYENQGFKLATHESYKFPPGFTVFINRESNKYFWVYYVDLEFKAASKYFENWQDCLVFAWQYFKNLEKGEKHD
jgi:hypothetical protein